MSRRRLTLTPLDATATLLATRPPALLSATQRDPARRSRCRLSPSTPYTRHRTLEFNLGTFLMVAPILLFSMTAHEWAHGYAAWKQGDPTAYQLGYVTWNPVKYIDPIMTVIVPIISF